MEIRRLLAQMTVADLDAAVKWRLACTFGVQVWADSERAGPQPTSSFRILMLIDPDGNTVVFSGA
ncbi:hypothetical protein FZI91_12915 [Mycobacterium sp. CBMA271]|uniref:hypothetical protein n=1 Tax=unclassified Mycobacteroides TaxID=2618759 RepID=UPI0012DDD461|nr:MULTISPECIES: hypothetical protein [unclassified Mycobacteroides]MUM18633.1 hypothetical protein [Mycobacteroides sp. CBMA 326]MUM22595.1 hypothetical protein [Mycobacteroides sp. CBMA 271]